MVVFQESKVPYSKPFWRSFNITKLGGQAAFQKVILMKETWVARWNLEKSSAKAPTRKRETAVLALPLRYGSTLRRNCFDTHPKTGCVSVSGAFWGAVWMGFGDG